MMELLLTKGKWYDLVASGEKLWDFRKGNRDIEVGKTVKFCEADEKGVKTGRYLLVNPTLVVHSGDFPPHFGWNGGEFTVFSFLFVVEKME
jgi:hypothetical protein